MRYLGDATVEARRKQRKALAAHPMQRTPRDWHLLARRERHHLLDEKARQLGRLVQMPVRGLPEVGQLLLVAHRSWLERGHDARGTSEATLPL